MLIKSFLTSKISTSKTILSWDVQIYISPNVVDTVSAKVSFTTGSINIPVCLLFTSLGKSCISRKSLILEIL